MILSFRTNSASLIAAAVILLITVVVSAMKLIISAEGMTLLVVFVISVALLFLLIGTVSLHFSLEQLRVHLEPKTGTVSYSYAGDSGGSAAKSSIRDELTHALIHSIAPHLSTRLSAESLGTYIQGVLNGVLGVPGANTASAARNAEQLETAKASLAVYGQLAASDGAMPVSSITQGEEADRRAEAEIVGKGLTAPRVTAEQIQGLMAQLTWRYEQPDGTTSTFANAFLGRFYLATGHSACVSPENFDATLGMKYAREQAEGKARDKLWELEGYKLAQQQVV